MGSDLRQTQVGTGGTEVGTGQHHAGLSIRAKAIVSPAVVYVSFRRPTLCWLVHAVTTRDMHIHATGRTAVTPYPQSCQSPRCPPTPRSAASRAATSTGHIPQTNHAVWNTSILPFESSMVAA